MLALVAPLAPGGELRAHEDELLAGLEPLQREQQPDRRTLAPVVARHLRGERSLPVHDLVVRQREDEALAEGIDRTKRQLVVVIVPVHGLPLQMLQRVVHPAHVPLHRETQPTVAHRPRHAREGRRLLGDREDARKAGLRRLVALAQERDGVEVLPAPVAVRHPAALFAGVVEVEHGSDSVDPQAVGVVAVEPEPGTRDEKRANLVAGVVELVAAPVRMRSGGADLRARTGACRRIRRGRTNQWRNGRGPNRGSRRTALVQ